MLTHLTIKNLVVVKSLDIDLSRGMTAITGETGAGKSIAIDALGLCLGNRADANMVRKGEDKADIIATFDVSKAKAARAWLQEQDLHSDDECIVRRVVSSEGRSKAYVNGTPVPLQSLKSLGALLVTIHGQHANQQLLKPDAQRQLLDEYANHSPLLSNVANICKQLKLKTRELSELQEQQDQRADRKQLLSYQLQELDDFALAEGEFEQLDAEHRRLSNSQTLLEQAQISVYQLYDADEGNALSMVRNSTDKLAELQQHDDALVPVVAMLGDAAIQIEEAAQELRNYCERLEIDPLRMQQVEQRFAKAMELARKHQVRPEELYAHHQHLAEEFASLNNDETAMEELTQACETLTVEYFSQAEQLSQSRAKAAKQFSSDIEKHIRDMNMEHAKVQIDVQFDTQSLPATHGVDTIQFNIATNAGQALDSLDKVVSGGELSRIGLAIQVLSAGDNAIPTMMFDEVDTGISGPTAAIVGQLLNKLGKHCQVMCVTHLPQVAASAHQQLFVTKLTDGDVTQTQMLALSQEQRVEELARLLAGDKLTDSALANARELLSQND